MFSENLLPLHLKAWKLAPTEAFVWNTELFITMLGTSYQNREASTEYTVIKGIKAQQQKKINNCALQCQNNTNKM